MLGKAVTAKNMTEVANEREAIELAVTLAEIQNKSNEPNKYHLGTTLYDKNLENSNKWNIISINEKKQIYGTGWNYIKKGDNIPDYGNAKNEWLVNYETGEIIRIRKRQLYGIFIQ